MEKFLHIYQGGKYWRSFHFYQSRKNLEDNLTKLVEDLFRVLFKLKKKMGQQRKRKNASQRKLSKEEEQKRRDQNLENYHRKKQGTCLFLLSHSQVCA